VGQAKVIEKAIPKGVLGIVLFGGAELIRISHMSNHLEQTFYYDINSLGVVTAAGASSWPNMKMEGGKFVKLY
jgi:hypothetical protein